MRIIVSGALGFMGREVANAVNAAGLETAFGVDMADGTAAFPLYHSFDEAPVAEDAVIIDFSKPSALESILNYAVSNHVPAVLATTGYSDEQLAMIDEAAKKIPVFRSYNMSLGVAVLCALSRKAAQILGDGYDVEIVEAHHNRKVDAPSGTAVMLYQSIKDEYDQPREAMYGRHGKDCKRQPQEIGMHSLRGGTVVGEHDVYFLGTSERIRLGHSAENRSVFAVGSVRAACYLATQPAGLYNMENLVSAI